MFFGSSDYFQDQPLNTTTIRLISDRVNLNKQIKAITAFDNVITLTNTPEISEDAGHGFIIRKLVESLKEKQYKFHPYVHDTFKCFCDNKKEIRITRYLAENVKDQALSDVLIPELVQQEWYDEDDLSVWFGDNKTQNMINPMIFDLFQNLKEVYIYGEYHPFSLSSFLSMIQNTSIRKVTIEIEGFSIMITSTSAEYVELKTKYKEKQYEMEIQHEGGCYDDSLIISKY